MKAITTTLTICLLLAACEQAQPAEEAGPQFYELEQRLESRPDDTEAMTELAQRYLQRARETGDAEDYARSLGLADGLEAVDAENAEAAHIRAHVAAALHNFTEALTQAERSLALQPRVARYYGPKVDALLEMGRYDEAVEALQVMVDTRPDFASYSRVAYVRELHGDTEGATEAMQSAISAGSAYGEHIAWAYTQLAHLQRRSSVDAAEASYDAALDVVENYAPALQGKGYLAAARGDLAEAEAYFTRVVQVRPLPEYLEDLVTTNELEGNLQEAARYRQLALAGYRAEEEAGENVDLELARFLVLFPEDESNEALERATQAYRDRPSISSASVLALAHARGGEFAVAQQYTEESLALGTQDPLLLLTAAIVQHGLGNAAEAETHLARAKAADPPYAALHAAWFTLP